MNPTPTASQKPVTNWSAQNRRHSLQVAGSLKVRANTQSPDRRLSSQPRVSPTRLGKGLPPNTNNNPLLSPNVPRKTPLRQCAHRLSLATRTELSECGLAATSLLSAVQTACSVDNVSLNLMDNQLLRRFSSQSSEKSADSTSTFSQEDLANADRFLQRRKSVNGKIGTIQPELYQQRGSVLTYSCPSGNSIGKLNMRLSYDYSRSDLTLVMNRCENLPATITEFYLKAILLPEIDGKNRETKRHKNQGRDPMMPATFAFPLTFEDVLDRRLVVHVVDSGRIGRAPVVVGTVDLDMRQMNPSSEVEVWAAIEPTNGDESLGVLLVQLNYLPSVQRLTVTVLEGKGLKTMDLTGSADPYVKVSLLQDKKVIKTRKTSVKKDSLSPMWNEPINFSLAERALKMCELELTLMDYDFISADDQMGRVLISSRSQDVRAQQLWSDVLTTKGGPATWLQLHNEDTEQLRTTPVTK